MKMICMPLFELYFCPSKLSMKTMVCITFGGGGQHLGNHTNQCVNNSSKNSQEFIFQALSNKYSKSPIYEPSSYELSKM